MLENLISTEICDWLLCHSAIRSLYACNYEIELHVNVVPRLQAWRLFFL